MIHALLVSFRTFVRTYRTFHAWPALVFAITGSIVQGAFPAGTPVSPRLIGQNFWLNPPDSAYTLIKESGVTLMRIGGITYDNNPLSDAALLRQVDNIRGIGAEPMIQVSRHKGAAVAAATVTYLNVTHRRAVKYWSIGNEPDIKWSGTETQMAAHVAGYIKEFSAAMRDVDPGIHLSAADMAFYSTTKFQALVGGASDITGKDTKGRFYIDNISFHRYPFNATFTRNGVLAEMHSGFESTVTALLGHVNLANALHRRTGADALTWSLTEFNLTYSNPPTSINNPAGLGVSSFINGQLFAEYYRVGMKHQALTMATWSLQEGGGSGSNTDFGFIGGSWATPIRRSSFHHMKMVADYLLPGGYLPSTTSVPNLAVLSTSSASQSLVSVMLLNQDSAGNQSFTIRLNQEPTLGSGTKINVSADLAKEYSGTLGNQSTAVLRFDSTGALQQRILYSLDRYTRNLPPSVETFPIFTRAPEAPTDLTGMRAGTGQVTLNWAGTAATGYIVQRATVREGPYAPIATGVMATHYTDSGLINGRPYFYVVSAVNPIGESAPSLPINVEPESAPPASLSFEAEVLPVVVNGSTSSVNSEALASGGSWVQLNSTSATPFMEFTTSSIPAGTYQLQLAYKATPNRGQLSFTVDGVAVGGTLDQYASTNRFTSIAVGTVTFATAAPHTLRLTATGKNPESTGFLVSADRFTFTAFEVATLRLGNLRQVFDGSPKVVSVNTTPAGLATSVTYNGSATAPVAPGVYPVTALINDPHYLGGINGTLIVAAAKTEGSRLSNVSVRTTLAANQILTVGLTMQGGKKPVLLRAAGPSLAALGVEGTMSDPSLALFDNTTRIATNDNWNGVTTVASAAATVGAFPFATSTSLDAALVAEIDGGRTLQVSGPSAGNVVVEAYDAGSGENPRLTNLSALNVVGSGGDRLIAGFTITGSTTKSTLIRAVGPSLVPLGVAGTLADPKLEVFTAANPPVRIADNDTYSATLSGVFASVGAFALLPGSKDAALLINLPPGGYTVHASGADGGTGTAIVEVYEVP